MLTPDKIKSKTFQTTATGSYRSEDVNNFIEEVADSYEQLFRENGSLIKKLSMLANKVEEYKKDEDSLRHALLAAQKLADQIVADSKEKSNIEYEQAKTDADEIVEKAKQEAQQILDDAKQTATKLVNDARYTADTTIHDANVKADELLGGINRKATQEKLVYDMLQKEVSDFRAKLMGLYEEHLILLDKIPAIVKESQDKIENDTYVEVTPETVADNVIQQPAEEEPVEEAPVDEEVAVDEIEEAFELSDFEVEEEPEAEAIEEEEIEDSFSLNLDIDDEELEETEEPQEEPEMEEDGFVIGEIDDEIDDEDLEAFSFTDISSDASSEEDGFSLDFSDVDLDDEEEIADELDEEEMDIKSKYASLDDEEELDDDDDDDDNGISFKKFFRKK